MRKTLLLLLLPLQLFSQSSVVAHTAIQATGVTTTSAINTTGATFLVIEASGIFGVGAISDSKGNTWAAQLVTVVHNTNLTTFICTSPCTVGSGHTFTQAANGSGFGESIAVQAFSGGRQIGGDFRDVNILTGLHAGTTISNDPPPHTIATAAFENTTAGVIALAVSQIEQGTLAASTIDSSFTVTDYVPGLTVAWKFITAASTTFDPTWTNPSDSLHQGAQLYGFIGTAAASYVPNFVITLGP